MDNNKIKISVEETLNSLEGLKRAEANPYLYTRITERIADIERNRTRKFSLEYGWKVLISFTIIVVINAFTLLMYIARGSSEATTKQDITSFVEEYSIVNTTYNY